jgi:hypothetical protein
VTGRVKCVRCEKRITGQVWVDQPTRYRMCEPCARTLPALIEAGAIVRQEDPR